MSAVGKSWWAILPFMGLTHFADRLLLWGGLLSWTWNVCRQSRGMPGFSGRRQWEVLDNLAALAAREKITFRLGWSRPFCSGLTPVLLGICSSEPLFDILENAWTLHCIHIDESTLGFHRPRQKKRPLFGCLVGGGSGGGLAPQPEMMQLRSATENPTRRLKGEADISAVARSVRREHCN